MKVNIVILMIFCSCSGELNMDSTDINKELKPSLTAVNYWWTDFTDNNQNSYHSRANINVIVFDKNASDDSIYLEIHIRKTYGDTAFVPYLKTGPFLASGVHRIPLYDTLTIIIGQYPNELLRASYDFQLNYFSAKTDSLLLRDSGWEVMSAAQFESHQQDITIN